jgi:hypothetical protein
VKWVAAGFGGVLGWSAWSNAPQLPGRATDGAVLLVLVVIVAAYVGGLRRGRHRVTATATSDAHAEASAAAQAHQTVQVYVGPQLHAADGATRASAAPLDVTQGTTALPAMPWLPPVRQLDAAAVLDEAGALDDLRQVD